MDEIATVLDFLLALGKIGALGFLAYGGWLASRCGSSFVNEGKGRFEYRHRKRSRAAPRIPAEERRFG